MGRIHLTKSLSDYDDNNDNSKTFKMLDDADEDVPTINDFIKIQRHIRNSDDNNKLIDEYEEQNQEDERRKQIIVYVGECTPITCGAEAACMNFQNNSYTCICPHDSSQPTKDFKCPNRRIVPLTPQPIHNIIPPSSIKNKKNNNNNNNNTITPIASSPTTNLNTTSTHNAILLSNNHHKQNHTSYKNVSSSLIINNNTTNNNKNDTNNVLKSTIPIIVNDVTTVTIIGIILMLIVLILSIICWYKRNIILRCLNLNQSNHIIKRRNINNKSSSNHNTPNTLINNSTAINAISPMNLKKSILLAERYTPNPQYSPCTTTIQSSCTPNISIIQREQLKFIQEIGEGCFGKVFKGELYKNKHDDNENDHNEDDNENIEIVAIKVLKQTSNIEAEEDFMREIDIMSTFRHTNILTLIGIVLKDINNNPWMIFEYMEYGDLAEVLRTHCKSSLLYNTTSSRRAKLSSKSLNNLFLEDLNQSHLLSAALQIADGMRYLAGQRFVHRDLACRNCLVNSHFIVKIADFGMSRDVYTCDYYKIGGSRLLPIRWMSPESVMYGRFTLESDVWSYGVVLWEIFSYGKQPYYGHNNEEVIKLILHNIMLIPSNDCPTFICDLMKLCWKTEPRDRIRFVDIYEQLYQYINTNSNNTTNISTSNTTLPRPPPITDVTSNIHIDLLDHDGYLMPQPINYNINSDYMQALPD